VTDAMTSPQLASVTPAPTAGGTVIEGVTVRRVSRVVHPPLVSGIHNIAAIELNVVEIRAAGHASLGYTYAFSVREAEAVTPLVLHIAETLLGRELASPDVHQAAMWRRINFIGRAGPPVMALSALDVALWDLHARSLGLPLHVVLGRPRIEQRVYAAGGSRAMDVDELVAEALRLQALGYAGYKLRIGSEDWREDVRRVAAVRSAVGPEPALMADVNQAWDADTATRAAAELAPLALAWLEEPVDSEDFAAMAAVRERAPMPIAAGESLYGAQGFARMIEAGAVDVLQPDLMRCGGISGYLQIAAMGESAGLQVAPHLFCEIVAHLASPSGAATLVEHLPGWFDGLFAGAALPRAGVISPTGAPGLGLALSQSAPAEHTIAEFRL
jgi:L-alanine-DL-glutamate epimerase-like enolase superfamily enzyme